jgi:hypothetical protein
MKKKQGLSLREIADIFGVSHETVRRDLIAIKRQRDEAMEGFKERFKQGEIVPREEIEAVWGPISDYDTIRDGWVAYHATVTNVTKPAQLPQDDCHICDKEK